MARLPTAVPSEWRTADERREPGATTVTAMAAMDTGKVDELRKRAQRDIDEGVLPSCQLALAKDGELVLQESYGDSTDDTRYVVFSSTSSDLPSAISWQRESLSSKSTFGPSVQLRHLAKIRAIVVLPVPRGPQNR